MSIVRFEPWIPKNLDPRCYGVRLLVLGESHYEEDDEKPWTELRLRVLTRYLVRRWGRRPKGRTQFFPNLYSLLTGRTWSQLSPDNAVIWDNIFFYNYVQKLVPGGARHSPDAEMWRDAEVAFLTVLDRLRPDAVLVLGRRLWRNMLDGELVSDDATALGRVYAFELPSGNGSVPAAHVYHPSSGRLRPLETHARLLRFLDAVKRTAPAVATTMS